MLVISFMLLGKISKRTDDLRTDRDHGGPLRGPQNPGENGFTGSPKFYDTSNMTAFNSYN
jgi:hypothetical protein